MATWDQGGGCACGVRKVCDCAAYSDEGNNMPNIDVIAHQVAERVRLENAVLELVKRIVRAEHPDIPDSHLHLYTGPIMIQWYKDSGFKPTWGEIPK